MIEDSDLDRLYAITQMVARMTGRRLDEFDQITPTSRVFQDAGLGGDEYGDFLDWFVDAYDVDLTSRNQVEFAPCEGHQLWPRRFLEMTVANYVTLSKARSWETSGLDRTVGRNFYGLLGWLVARLAPCWTRRRDIL